MWSFSAIANSEPRRAARLQASPPWEQIRQRIVERLSEALKTRKARLGREQSGENPDWLRTVVQFHVGEELLDWFFNAHSGYRAQFRQDWLHGLRENRALVDNLRSSLSKLPHDPVPCRLLSPSFVDLGETAVAPVDISASLEPNLSKVWACRDVMDGKGALRQVSLGLTTPRLVLPDGGYWLAISQDEPDAYLEIKGAFVTPSGPYQPKSPEIRAKAIQATGEPGIK